MIMITNETFWGFILFVGLNKPVKDVILGVFLLFEILHFTFQFQKIISRLIDNENHQLVAALKHPIVYYTLCVNVTLRSALILGDNKHNKSIWMQWVSTYFWPYSVKKLFSLMLLHLLNCAHGV